MKPLTLVLCLLGAIALSTGCHKKPVTVSPALTNPAYACAPDGDQKWCYCDVTGDTAKCGKEK